MKLALPAIPLFALIAFVNVGCSTSKPKAQSSPLDVGAPQAAAPAYSGPTYAQPAYSTPAYQPPAAQAAPAVAEPVAPAPAPAKATGTTYTVQKGDTLFGIAKQHYGDGSKWKKIASANPGMNPNAVKAGQKLIIPQ